MAGGVGRLPPRTVGVHAGCVLTAKRRQPQANSKRSPSSKLDDASLPVYLRMTGLVSIKLDLARSVNPSGPPLGPSLGTRHSTLQRFE
jgi:hypothetical protein